MFIAWFSSWVQTVQLRGTGVPLLAELLRPALILLRECSVAVSLATEAELTHLTENRAAVERPETKKALWKRFVAVHNKKIRRQNSTM
jgi:hypothetical protein